MRAFNDKLWDCCLIVILQITANTFAKKILFEVQSHLF